MKICFCREVNEDNVLIRNVLVEFEDSLKYVSKTYFALEWSIIVHFYRTHTHGAQISHNEAHCRAHRTVPRMHNIHNSLGSGFLSR
jgi:hypothetical protein